ncbi:HAMP domain-containing sensor histidine kinase [Paenibacillus senegalensis]|uniref:HAMP domain-containing sensor histidine kinase n=1 Tax=Paenibacillus senegalensis TaxID=1465766 RepID=UPI000289D25B|nr:ATP-binding protein [Paenibacillus senegalensis]
MTSLSIRWKLTLSSALLLFVLFAGFNAVQYILFDRFIIREEKSSMEKTMNDVLNYLLERETLLYENDIFAVRNMLRPFNQPHQFIRILDRNGERLAAVSDQFPEQLVSSAAVTLAESEQIAADGHTVLVLRSPLTIREFTGTIEIARSLEAFDRIYKAHFSLMIVSILIALALSVAGGRLLAGQLLKPLKSMAETIRKVQSKGLHERMKPQHKRDEISALMNLFNQMMDEVEESFYRQKQFVEDASHELRTPIAILQGHLSMLQRWGKHRPEVLEESLNAAVEELERLNMLAKELLVLTQAEHEDPVHHEAAIDPAAEIDTLLKKAKMIYPQFQFESELGAIESVRIAIPPRYLHQILLILLDNAVKYSTTDQSVRIHGYIGKGASAGDAVIEVRDRGTGISREDMPHVLKRFYRSDKSRSRQQGGTGLGLAIAERLVGRYGGRMEISSEELAGTAVRLYFPLYHDGSERG